MVRGLIHGWGIRDVTYQVSRTVPERWECPFYSRWRSVISRCKGSPRKSRAYDNCDVSEGFRRLTDFISWAKNEGFSEENCKIAYLDKDIIASGNKAYSPELCAFVPPILNSSIVCFSNNTGSYPVGVIERKKRDKKTTFITGCLMHKGKMQYLGVKETPEECHALWQSAKLESLLLLPDEYKLFCKETGIRLHSSVIDGILRRVDILSSDLQNKRITTTFNK